VTVRALLRGVQLPDGASVRIGDVRLLMMSRAKAADWPDVEVVPGDIETITWSTPSESANVAASLLEDERVVSVRVEAPEAG
jgi:hypothetical protein